MSNEEIWEWHQNERNFFDMKIDLSNASDVILMSSDENDDTIYKNMMTGASSYNANEVIRSDKRFICLRKTMNGEYPQGFHISSNEELDILVMVIAEFIEDTAQGPQWIEVARCYTSKNHSAYVDYIDNYLKNYIPRGNIVDICGQSPILGGTKKAPFTVMTVESKRIALNFFGGYVNVHDDDYPECEEYINLTDYDSFERLFSYTAHNGYDVRNNCYCKISFGGVKFFNKEPLIDSYDYDTYPIPEEAEKKLQFISHKELLMEKTDKLMFGLTPPCNLGYYGIIQNINEEAILRVFKPTIYCVFPFEQSSIELIEIERIGLKGIDVLYKLCATTIYIVWCDENLKSTVLEHTRYIVDDAIKIMDKELEESEYRVATGVADTEYYRKYCFSINKCAYVAGIIGSNPDVDAIVNVKCEKSDTFKSFMLRRIANSDYKLEKILEDYFGHIDRSQKSLHKIMKLPKGMFEYIITKHEPSTTHPVALIKSFFSTKEAEKYLSNMNKEDWMSFVEEIDNIYAFSNTRNKYILSALITLYGAYNWKGYIRHINKIWGKDYQDDYVNYLMRISEIGEAAKNAEWKLTGDALRKSYASLEAAYYAMTTDDYDRLTAKYKKLGDKWKTFSFSDGEYQIDYPKTPEEIVAEGVVLKHCVKEFIYSVAYEDTTILFIRQKKWPDRPFYTLEIKDGRIRQCHGTSNSTINDETAEFLLKFCKEKNIEYTRGERQLGV